MSKKAIVKTSSKTKTEAVSTQVVVASLEKKAEPFIKKLEKLSKITTQDQFALAGEQMKFVKEIRAEAKKQKEEGLDSAKKTIKWINSLFAPFEKRVDALEQEVKVSMLEYVERTTKLRSKVDEDFEAGKIKKVGTYTDKVNDLQIQNGAAQVRKITKLVMLDESKTPRLYLVPDTAAITAALKEGKKVAGWTLEKVDSISI